MSKRSNNEEFATKANIKHDFKYDYSKVNYVNAHIKVKIICPIHGPFPQKPNNHLRGQGCPRCAGYINYNNKNFIKKANIKHDFKYDYSKVNRISYDTKIIIICPTHGPFPQLPGAHLRGQGCKKCATEKSRKLQATGLNKFAEKANIRHDFKYDYSKVNYINDYTKIEIICPEHGPFPQIPSNHLGGSGCPECWISSLRSNKEEFIKKSNRRHNFKYDYSLVDYINDSTKVEIICLEHGPFPQTPGSHLRGQGCPKCAKNKKSNGAEFIKKANIKHDFKYDYSKVDYIRSNKKVKIICPIHGSFPQTPNNHLRGKGCPRCRSTISELETTWLNSLNIPNDKEHRNVTLKINNKRFRVDGFDPITNTVYEFNGDFWHGNPKIYKSNDINHINKRTFGELYNKTLEKELILKSYEYNIISIWESDFKKSNFYNFDICLCYPPC